MTVDAPAPTTWRGLEEEARVALGSLDARRIAEHVSGLDRAGLSLSADRPASPGVVLAARSLIARRGAGEPLQYVLGRWGFRSLDLMVDRRVLIPRPETELVVEVALTEAAAVRSGAGLIALDLGTGSGAIALSLASELAGAPGRRADAVVVWATERSGRALEVARANLAAVGGRAAERVRLLEGSWFEPLPPELRGRVALVVSNPPYLALGDDVDPAIGWEPREALFAGPTGFEAIDELVAEAPAWLASPGALVIELAPHQAAAAAERARRAGFGPVVVHPDLAGRPRVLVARS